VPTRGSEVDLRAPPEDLDERIEWFGRVSDRLVLLEEYSLPDLVFAVGQIEASVRDHLARTESLPPRPVARASGTEGLDELLRRDHARFHVSLEQLDWLLRIVSAEDHGGNRQALGQYGRLFTEALRQHRAEERPGVGSPGRLRAGRPGPLAEKP